MLFSNSCNGSEYLLSAYDYSKTFALRSGAALHQRSFLVTSFSSRHLMTMLITEELVMACNFV